ncbi:MAG: glycogen synthase [Brevinematia bacterium]
MFTKKLAKQNDKLNLVLISDHINHFFNNFEDMFSFEREFLCNFSHSLYRLGHNVYVILPFHKSIETSEEFKKLEFRKSEEIVIFDKNEGSEKKVDVMLYNCNGIKLLLIKSPSISNREGFLKDPANDMFYPDNLSRFVLFAKASLESLKIIPFKPDVIHIIGKWVSINAIYLKTLYKYDNFFRKSKVVFTIPSLHDIPLFVVDQYPILGLDWSFYRYEFLEFYGKVNTIKGAIIFSDITTFCSNSFIEEAKNPEVGRGFEGIISQAISEKKIKAIIPGVSKNILPSNDKYLSKIGLNYSVSNLTIKKKVKSLLCKKHKINDSEIVFLFIGEFCEINGISLVYEVFSDILSKVKASLIIIGKGRDFREFAIEELHSANKDKVVWIKDLNQEEISLYLAGSDVLLFPSMLETGNTLPMASMVYGTLPLVRDVGISNDIVRDKINGFKFYEYSPDSLKTKVLEVIDIYYKNPKRWEKIIQTSMKSDFSWDNVAKNYVEKVYCGTEK